MYSQSNIRETKGKKKTFAFASIQQNDMHSIKHSINNMRTKTKIRITQSKNNKHTYIHIQNIVVALQLIYPENKV